MFKQNARALKDLTSFFESRPQMFESSGKATVMKYVKDYKPSEPFVVILKEKNVVGKTAFGNNIQGGEVYLVNPNKTTGLFFKDAQHIILEEPAWTLFIQDNRPLPESDVKKIKDLMDW
tara:strand:- start:171 stop:527 length:357 start_codon:yes stop_codon:yes gene_type:complete